MVNVELDPWATINQANTSNEKENWGRKKDSHGMRNDETQGGKVMPFGLRNARATYQRLMDKVFANQIGRNLEVYMDDMVVKSIDPKQHIKDLEEIFDQVKRYNMRLNPKKCVIGVQGWKFLGFKLIYSGIEVHH
ncbi:Retrovirus-related Pol polyprotein from transposon 17.6, partial [Mucuna pruriens]